MKENPEVKADLDYLSKWIGVLAAVCFVFPASLLRPLGGWLSDRYGARLVMGAVFWGMLASGLLLSIPLGLNVWVFTLAVVRARRGDGYWQGERVQTRFRITSRVRSARWAGWWVCSAALGGVLDAADVGRDSRQHLRGTLSRRHSDRSASGSSQARPIRATSRAKIAVPSRSTKS